MIPFTGIIYKWWGFEGVNPKNFKRNMKLGKNITFVPGGYEEASLTSNS